MNNRYDNYRSDRRSQYGDYDQNGRQSHQWDQSGEQAGEQYADSDMDNDRFRSNRHDTGRAAQWDRGNDHRYDQRTSYSEAFETRGRSRPSSNDRFGGMSDRDAERFGSADRFGSNRYDSANSPRSFDRDYRSSRDDTRRYDQHDRGFFERAGDEIASWFGDDDAARRREADHRGSGPQNYARSDERILDDVCDHLTEDRYVDARNVTVTVQEREVTLDGTVSSKAAKRRAEDCADAVSGVRHVQNNLRVENQQSGAGRYETSADQVRSTTTPTL